MRKRLLSMWPMLLIFIGIFIGANGCAPLSLTGTARIGGGTSIGSGTFIRDLAHHARRFTGPVLYYRSYTGGVPQVTPYMNVNFMPEQDGTEFYLNCQCEDPAVKITEGSLDIGYDRGGDRFWIPNTRKGGERQVVVEVHCPGYDVPWTLPFYVQSSGPLIRRW